MMSKMPPAIEADTAPSCMLLLPPQSQPSVFRLSRCLSFIEEGLAKLDGRLVVVCFSSELACHASSYASVDQVIQCPEAYWDSLFDMLQGKLDRSPFIDLLKEHLCDEMVVPYVSRYQPLLGFLSTHLGLRLTPACMALDHSATQWGAALAPSWMFPVAQHKHRLLPVVCFEFMTTHSPEIASKPCSIRVIKGEGRCANAFSTMSSARDCLEKKLSASFRVPASAEVQPPNPIRGSHMLKSPLVAARLVFVLGAGVDSVEKVNALIAYARVLGAMVLATQGAHDRGFIDPNIPLIGQSGFKLKAAYYIGFGVSGAMQHMAGVAGSVGRVVVVNTKPEVELLSQADLLLIASLEDVLVALRRAYPLFFEEEKMPLAHD